MPTIKQFSRIQSQDDSLNRVQDQLAAALNPILRNVKGDLSGPLESPSVVALQGTPIANTTPTAGQSLVYNNGQWAPGAGGGGGGVTAVTATAPMSSSGGTTPNLSMTQAGPTSNGWLSSADWNTFNNAGGGAGDPNIVLLMAGSGTAGSTSFPDTSYIQATLTPFGNTQVVASPSEYGNGSASFDGNGDYITAPANAAYAFGTGDFTIEGWIYLNSYGGGGYSNLAGTIVDTQNAGGDPFAIIVLTTTTGNLIVWRGGPVLTSVGTIPLNTWTFFTVVRSSGTLTIYLNGAYDSSTSFTFNLTASSMTIGATIDGRAANTYLKYNGYMNDLRLSKIAQHMGAFTPPVAPFPSAVPGYALPIGPAGGDLTGSYPNPTVAQLNLGTLGYAPANLRASFGSDVNAYSQTVIQNTNSGSNASGALVVSNNLGNDSKYYTDFGLTSSTYGNLYDTFPEQPNSAFLTANGGFSSGDPAVNLNIGVYRGSGSTNIIYNGGLNAYVVNTAGALSLNSDFTGGTVTNNFGAAGQVLVSAGNSAPPLWQTPVFSSKLGNVAIVDAVNGNDGTGSVNGLPFKTVEAGIAAIAAFGSPATCWVMPGTYTLASATTGLTMPTGCAMRGHNTQTTKIVMNASNPGGTVTLLTMGENSRVEDVTLTLNSSNATTNLVGIALPGTTSVTSKFRTGVLTVDNSGLAVGTTTNVYGIYSSGTGTLNDATFSFNFTRGVTVNVKSNGAGSKLGLYMPSGAGSANQISTRDTNIYVAAPTDATSTGLYVGIYTDNDNSQVQVRSTSIRGAPYPAVQLKLPVAVTATTNITLSGTYTLQGVALTAGMRVLAAGQTVGTNNGIYIVAAGAWTRAGDMAAGSPALGAYTFCGGGTYTHTGWECTTNINVGAGSLTFVQRYVGSDILQNAPQAANGTNGIQLGPGTDLVTKTAATHPFTTYVTPTIAVFGLNAGIASSNTGTVRYCWPGTLASTGDTAQVFSRVQQKSIMQGMFINLRTAPSGSNSVQVTVLASKTGVAGSGVPTLMSATISGSATSATNYSTSVDFAQFDYFSVQVTGFGNSNSAADLVVQLDLF